MYNFASSEIKLNGQFRQHNDMHHFFTVEQNDATMFPEICIIGYFLA